MQADAGKSGQNARFLAGVLAGVKKGSPLPRIQLMSQRAGMSWRVRRTHTVLHTLAIVLALERGRV